MIRMPDQEARGTETPPMPIALRTLHPRITRIAQVRRQEGRALSIGHPTSMHVRSCEGAWSRTTEKLRDRQLRLHTLSKRDRYVRLRFSRTRMFTLMGVPSKPKISRNRRVMKRR